MLKSLKKAMANLNGEKKETKKVEQYNFEELDNTLDEFNKEMLDKLSSFTGLRS